ncbi:MAG: fructosamine kinase family protein [Anaerolineae bacterium]|nr:fructosamine kinase family protein [Anaerolineae bacterium]
MVALQGGHSTSSATHLGEGLARLHQITQAQHGLAQDNFIGSLPQPNTPSDDWLSFYRDQRIGAQVRLARARGSCHHNANAC